MYNDLLDMEDMSLCSLCRTVTIARMRGPNADQMQPHQPSYLALKTSSEAGCHLCQFLWMALRIGNSPLSTGDESVGAAALAHVSERYPGREISLVAWGGTGDNLDRIHVITTGKLPYQDDDSGDESHWVCDDPTMHPDHQIALDGVLELFAYPGMSPQSYYIQAQCPALTEEH